MKKVKSIYSKYWEWGFKSRLYDLLTPQAYLESLERTAHYCDLKTGQVLLDAGCGSGSLIPFLAKNLKGGGRYLGMDRLDSGFPGLIRMADRLGFGFGFETAEADGHNVDALRDVLAKPLSADKPTAVICHAVKGKGIPFAENEPAWHHKSRLPAEQIADMYAALEDSE